MKLLLNDERIWQGIVEEHTSMLLEHARSKLPKHLKNLSEDAVSQTFHNLFKYVKAQGGELEVEYMAAFLRMIIENVVKNYIKDDLNKRRLDVPLEEQHQEVEMTELTPEEHFIEREQEADLKDQMRLYIDLLPEQQRIALTMREVNRLPYKTIAQTMGITEVNSRNHVSQAKKALRRLLQKMKAGVSHE